ncbi:hypothetical protein OJAV_G00233940 [Oryzias javanicus]|uniref:Uncharacterized protein n=1 Tax=Oryzias javanicus TaxID=123683 RepID=A0A3S2MBB6_ORYJA|nr:hypothetical protein OJAV_G00233940 [Oryzias javanicus]
MNPRWKLDDDPPGLVAVRFLWAESVYRRCPPPPPPRISSQVAVAERGTRANRGGLTCRDRKRLRSDLEPDPAAIRSNSAGA